MGTPALSLDPAQPVDPANPTVARIQALIAMHQAEQANAIQPPTPASDAPMAPAQNAIAPPVAPVAVNAQNPQQTTAQPPAPSMAPPTPQQLGASLPQPDNPSVSQAPGPVKRFLTNFLYGSGQAMRHEVGLETDPQEQQRLANEKIAQQNATTNEGYKNIQGQLVQQQAAAAQAGNQPYTFGIDDSVPQPLRGMTMPTAVAQKLLNTLTQNQGRLDNTDSQGQNALALEQLKQAGGNPRDHILRSVGGEIGLYNKRDGSLVKDLGQDTSMITGPRNAFERAKAYAQFGGAQVMDVNGNPTTVSRLTQLQTGAPTVTEKVTQGLAGDKLGAMTYLGANKAVEDNLSVLRDPSQKAIIARATEDVDRNPGAIDTIINSALQQGLSPQGAKLISAMKQMNEFGSTFKKYTGNGGASTDSLRQTIHSNQPSTANSEAVNVNLLEQDRKLASGVLTNLERPSTYSVPAKRNAPNSSGGGVAPEGTVVQTSTGMQVKRGGKWVPQ